MCNHEYIYNTYSSQNHFSYRQRTGLINSTNSLHFCVPYIVSNLICQISFIFFLLLVHRQSNIQKFISETLFLSTTQGLFILSENYFIKDIRKLVTVGAILKTMEP